MVCENVVEGVRYHQQRKDVVELVPLLCPRLQSLSQHPKYVNGRLSIAFLEVLELGLRHFSVEMGTEL